MYAPPSPTPLTPPPARTRSASFGSGMRHPQVPGVAARRRLTSPACDEARRKSTRRALELHAREPVEPARQVPVPLAEQPHRGGHQDGADDGRVEQQRDGDAEADLLEHHELAEREADEDDDDDERGPCD